LSLSQSPNEVINNCTINIVLPWDIEPHTHGISNPLTRVYWTLCPWYIELPTHGILNRGVTIHRCTNASQYFLLRSTNRYVPLEWFRSDTVFYFNRVQYIMGGQYSITFVLVTISQWSNQQFYNQLNYCQKYLKRVFIGHQRNKTYRGLGSWEFYVKFVSVHHIVIISPY
jgi:hypothetical protein